MPNPLVHIVRSTNGFGHFCQGTFHESAEPVYRVFAKDEDILWTVEIIGGYLWVVRQELLVVEKGFERTTGQPCLPSLTNVDDATGTGKAVEIPGIGELLRRGARDDEVASHAFRFEAGAEVVEKSRTVLGQPAEETIGTNLIRPTGGIAEILTRTFHPVAFRLTRIEAGQPVS